MGQGGCNGPAVGSQSIRPRAPLVIAAVNRSASRAEPYPITTAAGCSLSSWLITPAPEGAARRNPTSTRSAGQAVNASIRADPSATTRILPGPDCRGQQSHELLPDK